LRTFFLALTLLLLHSQLDAGIFDSLFGTSEKKSDVVVEESDELSPQNEEEIISPSDQEQIIADEKVIVEEEVISADEYMDSSDENQDAIFEDQAVAPEPPAYQEESAVAEEDITDIAPTAPEENDPFIKVRNILLSYVKKPEKIYLLQHFPITIKAIIPQTNVTAIQTEFVGGKSFRVLNPDTPWVKTGENSYENTFYLKLLNKDAKLPNIKVTNQTANGTVKSELLKAFRTKIISLREDELFSRVIADNLQVMHHQERPYDESANIVVMEINATNGNLEDFHIPFASREGIDQIQNKGLYQKIYFFAIVSNVKKHFKFKYFNPQKNRFEIVSFAIKPIDTSISTHTELNPQKNKYILYKVIFLVVMALIFVGLFIFYRKYYFLLGALVFIGLLAYVQIPIRKVQVPSGTALRILPMPSSTVFFRTDKPTEVDILLKKKQYTKVLLPNKKIGWIKNEDIR